VEVPDERRERERERLKGHRSTTSRKEQGGMGRSKQGGGSIGKDHPPAALVKPS
jgi:hypothetical protein